MYPCTTNVMEVVADIVACIAMGCVGVALITGTIALVYYLYKVMK